MRTSLAYYYMAAAVLTAGGFSTSGLHADDPAPLRIFTAVEVEFGTAVGRVYQLQGSSNLVDWVSIGDPVFGVGRTVDQVFSTRNGGEVAFGSYRLQEVAAPTNGLAPWSLAGLTFSLDDEPGHDLVRFTDATTGIESGSDPFGYSFLRVDADTVRADVQRGSDRHDLLTLTFTATARGTWVREEYRKNRLKDRDVGGFTVVSNVISGPVNPEDGATNPVVVGVVPVPIPAVLTGLAYQFQASGVPERLNFTSATAGVELGDDVADDEANGFTYVYASTGTNTASLRVNFQPGRHDEYDLVFGDGLHGRFVRREFRGDRLKDADHGAFSAVGAIGIPGSGVDDHGGLGGDDSGGHGGDDHGGHGGGGSGGDDGGGYYGGGSAGGTGTVHP